MKVALIIISFIVVVLLIVVLVARFDYEKEYPERQLGEKIELGLYDSIGGSKEIYTPVKIPISDDDFLIVNATRRGRGGEPNLVIVRHNGSVVFRAEAPHNPPFNQPRFTQDEVEYHFEIETDDGLKSFYMTISAGKLNNLGRPVTLYITVQENRNKLAALSSDFMLHHI